MRVALYARYSSEGQREASIADQFRNCESYATRQGWRIVQRYEDRAISGAKDEKDRDGFCALLAGAKAKQFDVVLVHDLSRLSRDSVKTEQTRRQLVFWGVRLIGASDGIDTAHEGHEIMSGVKGLFNQQYLLDLAKHTHKGQSGQALKGYNCGGRSYGYKHIPIEHPTEKDEYGRPRIVAVKREPDPDQAKIVRQVFQWYAEGHSPRWIAGELNRRKVPAPGAAYNRKHKTRLTGTWAASALHGDPKQGTGLLHNPLYIGRVIWNRRKWVRNPDTNRKTPRLRPESEWIISEQPSLRIVPQVLWDQVQVRRKSRPEMKRGTPVLNSKYVLSGLLICAECESHFVIASATSYACAGTLNRRACGNTLRVRRDVVEARCLNGIRSQLFTPERMALFTKETTRLLAERKRAHRPELERVEKELVGVQTSITNLLNAMKQGIVTASTKAELERLEAERDRLHARVQDGVQDVGRVVALLPRAKERYEALVGSLSRLPARHLAPLREKIRALIGEIRLHPNAEGYLEAEMVGRFEGLLRLAVGNSVGCGERI